MKCDQTVIWLKTQSNGPPTVKLAAPQILQLAQTGTVTYQLKPNSLVVLRFEGARDE